MFWGEEVGVDLCAEFGGQGGEEGLRWVGLVGRYVVDEAVEGMEKPGERMVGHFVIDARRSWCLFWSTFPFRKSEEEAPKLEIRDFAQMFTQVRHPTHACTYIK